MPPRRLRCRHVVGPDGVLDDAVVEIEGERIVAVGHDPAEGESLDGWLVPGFVDIHCHGGGGAEFSDPDPAAVARAIRLHRRHGTTTQLASLVSAPLPELRRHLAALTPFVAAGELAGIHLEGPCLAPGRKGAHPAAALRHPDPAVLDDLLAAGAGVLRMITLAPDLPGGLAAVARLRAAGVVVAFGHSDADAATTAAAIDAGAGVATHLWNAMRPLHHRAPGPVPVLLRDPRVACEVICDGLHVDPLVVALAVSAAGPDRIALVTDAMAATGCGDGTYLLGGLDVTVRAGTARLAQPDGRGPLAGSTLTMDRAFAFVVQRLGRSICDAARMAATTPARALGLDEVGMLAPGCYADACLVGEDGTLRRVLRRGRWVGEVSDTPAADA